MQARSGDTALGSGGYNVNWTAELSDCAGHLPTTRTTDWSAFWPQSAGSGAPGAMSSGSFYARMLCLALFCIYAVSLLATRICSATEKKESYKED